ncbi:16S rRNA (guanine(527)-N(7))-methyltransferase RsmG [Thermithiobacillus plumbiphilus]|uniref:Ribosomal RNA small subunit methyltransferase G n=1 Tax=Thermithiobacillus plumbiphilus TaxID=1729899 RepID=A0ABU9DA96_9PROT
MERGDILEQELRAGLKALGQQDLNDQQVQQLVAYIGLLARWNRAYNLTAVREPRAMVERHLLDSLGVRPYLCGQRILDVGTGAGLPGIPLAIAEPGRHFILLDSLGKRMVFLQQVLLELKLENVTLVQARVEAYQPVEPVDCILSRAFANFADFMKAIDHLLLPGTTVLAMKGPAAETELAAWQAQHPNQSAPQLISLTIPGAGEQRSLLCWRQSWDRSSP